MGKKLLCIVAMLLLVGGCAQGEDKNQESTGKIALDKNISDILDTLKDTSTKDEEKSDDKSVSTETEKEDKQTAETNAQENSSSTKQSTNSKSNQTDSSNQTSQSASSGNSNQQSSNSSNQEQPKQETSQSQKEPAKPVEQTQPKPSVPACDDTIPSGAYPVSKEDEICSQIQAEIIKNLNEGKPTFERYEVEYGYTECGTEYFYIIYK